MRVDGWELYPVGFLYATWFELHRLILLLSFFPFLINIPLEHSTLIIKQPLVCDGTRPDDFYHPEGDSI